MVFAKKKFTEVWEKKVLEAGRKYCEYDDVWGDDKVKSKIKDWKNANKGFQCNEAPISSYCAKGTCVRRKFGVGSYKETSWPELSGCIRINYKPEPEYMIDVALDNQKVKQIHAKNIRKVSEMKELRNLIADHTKIIPPLIKGPEFQSILNGLWNTLKNQAPPVGTSPIEMLKKYMIEYVNGPQATTYASFKSGSVLKDEDFYYFEYDKFYEEIRRSEWNKDRSRTARMITTSFSGDFDCQKRFPKKESEKSFPPLRVLKLPVADLEKEEIPDETVTIEDKEHIV
jgi:hypothetical protein